MGLGEYQPEYNAKVHGPYDPARWYGKPDTHISDVKLGDLASWLGRRTKSPQAAIASISRAWWRYQHRWIQPTKLSFAGPMQIILITMGVFYYGNYAKYRTHRLYKYHW